MKEKYPKKFGFSISYTTRAPRAGEVHGKNYFFTDENTFKEMIEKDDVIEWCQVHQNFYGTSKSQIRDITNEWLIPLLDIDI